MPCFYPVPARQDAPGGPVRLRPPLGTATLSLPCGQCIGCRHARAVEWSRRCCHEAAFYENNVFLTLTYDDEHFPPSGSLVPEHLQLFIKRVRKAASRDGPVVSSGEGVRFFACGEYGERTGRPHYHVIFFNLAFSDQHKVAKNLYGSDALARLWSYGNATIGEVTAASAAYVAKYNLKSLARNYVTEDGEVVVKPFLRMSRRPGLGVRWLERFKGDLQGGFLVADGVRNRIPRAYLRRLAKVDSALAEELTFKAYKRHIDSGSDASEPERLEAAAVIAKSRIKSRNLGA